MKPKLWIVLSAIALIAPSCPARREAPPPIVAGPQVWIDAPLPGASLPLAPYEVVSHAAHPGGIAAFELSVDGQVLRTEPAEPNSGETLASVHQLWEPAAPGQYRLSVRAADMSGAFGVAAEVWVIVGEGTEESRPSPTSTDTPTAAARLTETPTPTPTDTPTLTPTPTATRPAPTRTPSPTPTPTPVPDTAGPSIGPPSASPNPNGLPSLCRAVPPTTVSVAVSDPSGVAAVYLHVTYQGVEQVIGMVGGAGTDIVSGQWAVPAKANGGEATFFVRAVDALGNQSTGGSGVISLSRTVCP